MGLLVVYMRCEGEPIAQAELAHEPAVIFDGRYLLLDGGSVRSRTDTLARLA